MGEKEFSGLFTFLRNIKDLSKDEAKVLIKIIGKGGVVTANDVSDILKELKLSNPVSRPYILLRNLESKEVIYEEPNSSSKNKMYHAIHPRDLLLEIKGDMGNLDSEIGLLEQSRDVPSKKFDPREETKILKNELFITTGVSECLNAGDTIEVFVNPKVIPKGCPLYKKLSELIKPEEIKSSKINVIFISNTKKEEYKIIFIFMMVEATSEKIKYFGDQIMDKNIFDFTKNGIEKNGKK